MRYGACGISAGARLLILGCRSRSPFSRRGSRELELNLSLRGEAGRAGAADGAARLCAFRSGGLCLPCYRCQGGRQRYFMFLLFALVSVLVLVLVVVLVPVLTVVFALV